MVELIFKTIIFPIDELESYHNECVSVPTLTLSLFLNIFKSSKTLLATELQFSEEHFE